MIEQPFQPSELQGSGLLFEKRENKFTICTNMQLKCRFVQISTISPKFIQVTTRFIDLRSRIICRFQFSLGNKGMTSAVTNDINVNKLSQS